MAVVSPPLTRKYFLQTFGCQMNKSDSEHVKGVLEKIPMVECEEPAEADLIILNTCSIRQAAEDKAIGIVKNYGELKKNKPDLIIGVTGCMVGHDKKRELLKKMPAVDLYFPISETDSLPKKITELTYGTVSDETTSDSPIAYLETPAKYSSPFEAYIPIMSGCNKFCTFCIVPYSRGREISRNGQSILSEIRALQERGYQMVTLVGQNVNSYHPGDSFQHPDNPYRDDFAALLWEINRIGVPWVHFTAPHPRDMGEEVIDALTLPCMVNSLHLPVQAGDDQILKAMNRQYTSRDYLNLVDRIRRKKPAITLATDIIVGFPGETEEQFEHTIELYRQADFDIAYTAIYSPRAHTPAARMKNQLSQKVKKDRWQRLQLVMEEMVERKNKKYAGQTVEVLIKEAKADGLYLGETRELKKITVRAPALALGKRTEALVQETSTWMLYGVAAGNDNNHQAVSTRRKLVTIGK